MCMTGGSFVAGPLSFALAVRVRIARSCLYSLLVCVSFRCMFGRQNGSDFTELTVSSWGDRNCSVLLQTTVVNNGQDLYYLATATGPYVCLACHLLTSLLLPLRSVCCRGRCLCLS